MSNGRSLRQTKPADRLPIRLCIVSFYYRTIKNRIIKKRTRFIMCTYASAL